MTIGPSDATDDQGAARLQPVDLRGPRRRQRKENVIRHGFRAAATISLVVSALIVVSLSSEALAFVGGIDARNLFTDGWFPRRGMFDLRTIFGGTLVVTVIAMAVAAPLGLGSAIYLAECAGPRLRNALKPILEMLAGIPSVVLGFFALTWISPEVVRRLWGDATSFNVAAAGIGVGILVTPLVASISEDAMRAVPSSLREASYGLGARRTATTLKVVVPSAVSGIVAALIVGVSRAVGETMIVAIAAGGTGGSELSLDPAAPGQTMTGAMAALAVGSDQVKGESAFQSLFFVGLLLFAITLALNVVSERFVRRARRT